MPQSFSSTRRVTAALMAVVLSVALVSTAAAQGGSSSAAGLPTARQPGHRVDRSVLVPLAKGTRDLQTHQVTSDASATDLRPVTSHALRMGQGTVAVPGGARALANADAAPEVVRGAGSTWEVAFDPAFDDPANADAKAAVHRAVQTWADRLYSPDVPITLAVAWQAMPDDVLAAGGPTDFIPFDDEPNVVYPKALADYQADVDTDPGYADMGVVFNSGLASSHEWYYGTDTPPAGTWDLETTAVHELTHGLGFWSTFAADGDPDWDCPVGRGCYGGYPEINPAVIVPFDRHLTYGQGASATKLTAAPNNSTTLKSKLTSGNVYWSGQYADAASGSSWPRLYAPSTWQPGSSISHISPVAYPAGPDSLMTPVQPDGAATRTPGPVTVAMLDDFGWIDMDLRAQLTKFIDAAYQDFLTRAPTPGEVDGNLLLSSYGHSRTDLVLSLANSDEWVGHLVTQMYQDTLGRDPDSGGLAYWSDRIETGASTVAQVAAFLYSSNEFFRVAGHGSLSTWVGLLYQKLLHRSADKDGLAYWVSIAQRLGRPTVAYSLYQSAESRRDRVTALYQQLLGRAPDSGGLSYWSDRILTDGDLALAAYLAGSNEYFHRAQTRA